MNAQSEHPAALLHAAPVQKLPQADCGLLELATRTRARVLGLAADIDAELGLRLTELGFLPGESVQVVARAAFGGPLAVRIGTATFALRTSEAAGIRVSPVR